MPIDEKEMTKINIRLTREEKDICDAEARKKGMSRNAFLRELILVKNEGPTLESLDDKLTYLVCHLGDLDNKKQL